MALRPGEPFDRYVVEALLGEGGMGHVYRAHDTRLRRPVALKVLARREGKAPADGAAARLVREARAAAAIVHPNAVAIYDVGEVDGTPYLAMELVEGRSLRTQVGDPAVPLRTRLVWLAQIARALAAAHRRGVVHRDVKPENVMVREDGVVKVVDFGIARAAATSNEGGAPGASPTPAALTTLTGAGVAVGTPLYMAPEQLRQDAIDGRCDQFAWGVVAWELCAGTPPWPVAQGAVHVLTHILTVEPPPLGAHAAGLPPEVELVVGRALAKRPEDRFATTDDLVAAFEAASGVAGFATPGAGVVEDGTGGAAVPTPAGSGGSGPRAATPAALAAATPGVDLASTVRAASVPAAPAGGEPSARTGARTGALGPRTRLRVAFAIAGTLAAVGALAYAGSRLAARGAAPTVAPSAEGARAVIAVTELRALGDAPDVAWLAAAVPEMLATELGGADLRVVPRERTARAAREAPDDPAAGARATGAAYVVGGSFAALPPSSVRLDLEVRAAGGAELARFALSGDARELFDLVGRAGAEIRRRLGRAALTPEQSASRRAALPKSPEAAKAFAEGLALFRAYDFGRAREALGRAVAAEPEFAMGHAALARALAAVGRDADATREAQIALDRSADLSREQRLVLEAALARARRDWAAGVDAWRTLHGFFPDELDYGLAYVDALAMAGRSGEALAVVAKLRGLPLDARDLVRVALTEASAAGKAGDYPRWKRAADDAVTRARALGLATYLAQGLEAREEAEQKLGEIDAAEADCEEARAIFGRVGMLSELGATMIDRAQLRARRGDPAGAERLTLEAIEVHRRAGDEYQIARGIVSLGILRAQQGHLRAARASFEEGRAAWERLNDKEGLAHTTNNAAVMMLDLGELDGALAAFAAALALYVEIGNKEGVAGNAQNVGDALLRAGKLEEAERRLEEGVRLADALGARPLAALAHARLGDVARDRGDPARARAEYDAAAAALEAAGEVDDLADVRTALARVALDEGKNDQATRLAEVALAATKTPDVVCAALAARVVADARSKRLEAAREGLARMDPVADTSERPALRAIAAVAAAEARAALGDLEGARAAAARAVDAARAAHAPRLELEARLALAAVGHDPSARARVAAEARAAGQLRVARLAARP